VRQAAECTKRVGYPCPYHSTGTRITKSPERDGESIRAAEGSYDRGVGQCAALRVAARADHDLSDARLPVDFRQAAIDASGYKRSSRCLKTWDDTRVLTKSIHMHILCVDPIRHCTAGIADIFLTLTVNNHSSKI
jgi:hypothetical protein